MKRNLIFLIAVVLLSQTIFGMQDDLRTQVDQQVNRIRSITGTSEEGFFALPGMSESISPIQPLIKLGMDAIPYLIPYLADDSEMQAYRTHTNGLKRVARVNEYIMIAINRIADHEFGPLPGGYPDDADNKEHLSQAKRIEILQNQIQSWWDANRTRSLIERKIADIGDTNHTNRFAAYQWLGREKAKEARRPLEQRIENLLTGEVNTLKQSEMAACATSLASIGNSESASAVRKVCDHLSYWVYMSYRPSEQGRAGVGSSQVATLFEGYHALADLGFKDEALSQLKEIETKYLKEMEADLRAEFVRDFENAQKW